jgi:hypothetical protein
MTKRLIRDVALLVGAVVIVLAGLAGIGRLVSSGHSSPPHLAHPDPKPVPRGAIRLTVGRRPYGRAIPSAFVGFSFEYSALPAYAGSNPRAINPVLEQLVRNVTAGTSPVLRIGGDSTDWAWVPARHVSQPPGKNYALTRRWLAVAGALARSLDARMIFGINLEAGSKSLASSEARALVAAVGPSHMQALELGNEPELYSTFAWYRTSNGKKVYGRRPGYDLSDYARELSRYGAAFPAVPLAGPATGAPKWMHELGRLVPAAPGLGLVTVHRYPLERCYVPPSSPEYGTIPNLLTPLASSGLADTVARGVAVAHRRGVPFRVDEFNSVACSGRFGVSDTFASSLWMVDALFQMATVGVDGVNIHTLPGAAYQPFTFTRVHRAWVASVKPEYYGLMMFTQAAPAGARLLPVRGVDRPGLRAWATRGTDGQIRVVLINEDLQDARTVAIGIPGAGGAPAAVERLRAPSIAAKSGVALGGQSFAAATRSGVLAGKSRVSVVQPAIGGSYVVKVPPASAALVTVVPGS